MDARWMMTWFLTPMLPIASKSDYSSSIIQNWILGSVPPDSHLGIENQQNFISGAEYQEFI